MQCKSCGRPVNPLTYITFYGKKSGTLVFCEERAHRNKYGYPYFTDCFNRWKEERPDEYREEV